MLPRALLLTLLLKLSNSLSSPVGPADSLPVSQDDSSWASVSLPSETLLPPKLLAPALDAGRAGVWLPLCGVWEPPAQIQVSRLWHAMCTKDENWKASLGKSCSQQLGVM
jgi:hypothetical protein